MPGYARSPAASHWIRRDSSRRSMETRPECSQRDRPIAWNRRRRRPLCRPVSGSARRGCAEPCRMRRDRNRSRVDKISRTWPDFRLSRGSRAARRASRVRTTWDGSRPSALPLRPSPTSASPGIYRLPHEHRYSSPSGDPRIAIALPCCSRLPGADSPQRVHPAHGGLQLARGRDASTGSRRADRP